MQIFFDNIIFSLQTAGGISVYWQNLLSELKRAGVDFTAVEYPGAMDNVFRQNLELDQNQLITKTGGFSKIIEQFKPVKSKNFSKPFIFHSSYYRYSSNPLAKNVVTIHDFIYEKRYAPIGLPERIRMMLTRRCISKGDKIVCVSENTRRDLFQILPSIPQENVCVIHNGVSDVYRPIDERLPLSEYVLYVGGRDSYKNFNFAVSAIAKSRYKLIICGNKLSSTEMDMLETVLGKDRYIFRLLPSDEELNQIYNSVHCLLYPSSYEGFGIPILEAQRASCPVIALNTSSIPEVMGNGGIYLEELDVNEFLSALDSLESSQYRNEIVLEGIKNASNFSWQKMAAEYMALYQTLL